MNIETLRQEKESCRRRIITFSVLAGVALFLVILSAIIYVVGVANFSANFTGNEEGLAKTIIIMTSIYIIITVILALAICAFTPFIVINSIKFGKRRRLLNQIDDGGAINV